MTDEYPNWKKGLALLVGIFMVGVFCGLGFGWHFWRATPEPTKPLVNLPAQELPGGGVVLPTQPQPHPQPQQHLPAGSHVEQTITVTVTVQPSATHAQPLQPLPTTPAVDLPPIPCPPVRVDLTLYRDSEGRRRVAASSPDGQILPGASVDIPDVMGPPAPKPLLNSAGLVMGTTAWGDKAVGVYYDRDWKFLRVGGEVTKNTYALANRVGWEVRAKLGIIY